MDGDDGIGGVIGDVLGEVGSEIKKIGKSAVGQVTGSSDDSKTGNGDSANSSQSADISVGGEAASFGKGIVAQVTGRDLDEMKTADDKFSEQGQEEIKARIAAIYSQHAQKRRREEEMKKRQEVQVETQKKEFKEQEKKQSMDVTVAQTKANAEIKNMGAE